MIEESHHCVTATLRGEKCSAPWHRAMTLRVLYFENHAASRHQQVFSSAASVSAT